MLEINVAELLVFVLLVVKFHGQLQGVGGERSES